MDRKNDNFYFTINCLNKSGLRRSCSSPMKYVSVYVLLPLLLIFYGMVIFNFQYMNNDIVEISQVFDAVATFGQLVVRKLILLLHGDKIEEVIDERSHFLSYDLFGEELGRRYRNRMKFRITVIKFFWTVAFFTSFMFVLTPLFVKDVLLPHTCWIPGNNGILRIVIYNLEIIYYVELTLLIGVFDGIFLFTCLEIQIQFELLKRSIQSINFGLDSGEEYEKFCLVKLKTCSIHHNFLLGLSNFTQIVRSVLYIAVLNLQGALFFIPASDVEAEAETLPDEIYSTDWYNTKNRKIHKFILFWLIKAQRPMIMS
ncbi:7tm 6 domain containing protein, partial [Asbolus verrucosus]